MQKHHLIFLLAIAVIATGCNKEEPLDYPISLYAVGMNPADENTVLYLGNGETDSSYLVASEIFTAVSDPLYEEIYFPISIVLNNAYYCTFTYVDDSYETINTDRTENEIRILCDDQIVVGNFEYLQGPYTFIDGGYGVYWHKSEPDTVCRIFYLGNFNLADFELGSGDSLIVGKMEFEYNVLRVE